jgi:hypothetical protein
VRLLLLLCLLLLLGSWRLWAEVAVATEEEEEQRLWELIRKLKEVVALATTGMEEEEEVLQRVRIFCSRREMCRLPRM